MTITSVNRKAGPFLGDGVTTEFPFDFKVFKKEDVAVTFTNVNGADGPLALDSDYSVTLNGDQDNNPGGTVVYPRVGSPLPILQLGEKLTLTGGLAYTQPTDLPNLSPYFPQVVEDALDRAEIQIQQVKEITDRAIKIGVSDTPLTPLPSAPARANTVIGFDALGNVTVLPLPSALGAGDMINDIFTAGIDFTPGVTTQLPLSRAPGVKANVEVHFDATFQGPDQWNVTGSALIFNDPIPVGVTRVYARVGTSLSTQVPPAGSVGDDTIDWGTILYRAVDSVALLRQLDGNLYKRAKTAGYNGPGTFGRGEYWNDTSDTTSVDDGGMVIVGNDGTRWKLLHDGQVSTSQYGVGTVDDTTRLQAAITGAAAAGINLWFDALSTVSGALNLVSGTDIDGFPWCGIKLKDNCTPKPVDLLRCNTATGVRVRNITVNANRTNNVDHGAPDGSGNQATTWQGTLLAAIDFAYVTDFKLEDLTVRDCWGSGIWITDCQSGDIEGNYVLNHRITGIAIRNNTADPRPVKDIRVVGNHCEGGIVGIHTIFGAVGVTISDNVCINNKDQNRFPAYAYSGAYPNVYPSTGGFTAFGQPGYVSPALPGDGAGIEATGVFTDPSGTANLHVAVTGNTCSQNAVGIRMEETTNKFAVTGNSCLQNDFYGILGLSAYFNTITGNTCSLNGLDGIRLEKIPGKPQAANNIVANNISTENGRFGVIVVGSQGNIIQGNNLGGNGATTSLTESGPIGLYVGDSVPVVGTLINGNQIQNVYGTDKYGIYSNSASNVGNLVLGNQFSGSYVTAKNNLNTGTNTFEHNINFP
ncbi:hypothetical protein CBM2623_A170019 [Cupriavidus taiwanensis]|uniref:NosD domain-containing protein n=1 Tax=Cupriavidus taiwanensis TaxID=164546 RepID=UPI000E13255D|nr:right-handed parallel beta-helix repeat-containing protein [Cupriavidus taiwanensis]SPA25864.1 hypothetical protein CBM2623_A170019 [Cupriavidus taiwanensis]